MQPIILLLAFMRVVPGCGCREGYDLGDLREGLDGEAVVDALKRVQENQRATSEGAQGVLSRCGARGGARCMGLCAVGKDSEEAFRVWVPVNVCLMGWHTLVMQGRWAGGAVWHPCRGGGRDAQAAQGVAHLPRDLGPHGVG